MSAKCFFDTNLLVYLYSVDEPMKRRAVEQRLSETGSALISIQVVSELSNVLLRKFKLDEKEVADVINELESRFGIWPQSTATIRSALDLKAQFQFSYFDSLIVASAIESGCETLYSEDFQHGQSIGKRLRIVNPLL